MSIEVISFTQTLSFNTAHHGLELDSLTDTFFSVSLFLSECKVYFCVAHIYQRTRKKAKKRKFRPWVLNEPVGKEVGNC